MKRKIIFIAALIAHMLPVVAWAMVKPLRVVAPELVGLSCTEDNICTDDLSRLNEARALLISSYKFVGDQLGDVQSRPRAVFCSTAECASKFGLVRSVAVNVASVGVIFSERAWKPYYVRHELIHQLQNERLGVVNAWLFKPSWFVEGMAYSRSEDPHRPLPEPFESYRRQYEVWEGQHQAADLWAAAKDVR